MSKKILVAVGTSEHKKEFAVKTIEDYCLKKQIEVEVKGESVYKMNIENEKPDVIVLIGPKIFNTDIPVITGTAFVTKLGMEKVCEKIVSKL